MRLQSLMASLRQAYMLKRRLAMAGPRGGRRLVNTVLASGSLMALVYWLALSHSDIGNIPVPTQLAVAGSVAESNDRPAMSRRVSPLTDSQRDDQSDDGPPQLWVPVIEEQLMAYGAYWDVRSVQNMRPPFIRVLVTSLDYGDAQRDHFQDYASQRLSKAKLQCRLHYSSLSGDEGGSAEEGEGRGSTRLVPATVVPHPVYDGAATFDILCDVQQAVSKRRGQAKGKRKGKGKGKGGGVVALPPTVSLHCPDCANPPWALQIRDRAAAVHFLQTRLAPAPPLTQLAICVRPAYGPLDDVIALLEFVSFYFAMGAGRLTFYSTGGLGPGAQKLLDYAHRGLGLRVEVLPWNWHAPPSGHKSTVHAWNQHAAVNACMLRHRYTAEHVAMVDLDEYIVPRPPFSSLPALLQALDRDYPLASGFQLRNAFFFLKLGRDTAAPREGENTDTTPEKYAESPAEKAGEGDLLSSFRVFAYTRRMPVYPPGNRSKAIVKPSRMLWTNIHGSRGGMGQPCEGVEEVVVGPQVALLQHYRAAFPEPESMTNVDAQVNVKGREVKDDAALRLKKVVGGWAPLRPLSDFVRTLDTADDVLV